jgi:pyruvate/2-oxoglutarate dehydrogenase complex dihydrolipoamide dehydrogenase (E3) component
MIGPEAGEVMAVVQIAMLGGLPYTALRDVIITHPTMAEGLNALFSSVEQYDKGKVIQKRNVT